MVETIDKKKAGIGAAIVCLMLCSMTSTATVISPVIGKYIAYYGELGYSAATVKQILSMPKLFSVIMAIVGVGFLVDRIDNKILGIIGSAGIGILGIISAFVSNFTVLLVLRACMGLLLGLLAPFFAGWMGRLFDGETFKRLVGLKQTAAAVFSSVGSMTIGLLAANKFQNANFWYVFDIIIAILIVIFIPSMPAPTKEQREAAKREAEERKKADAIKAGSVDDDVRKKAIRMVWIMAFLYFLMNIIRFSTYSNLTLCVTENGGSTMAASTAQSIRTLSAAVCAIFFKEASKLLKKYVVPICLCLTGIGMIIIGKSTSNFGIFAGAFIFGGFYGFVNPAFYNSVNNAKKVGATVNVKNAGIMAIATDLGSYASSYVMDPIFNKLGYENAAPQMVFGGLVFAIASVVVIIAFLLRRKPAQTV